jgi:hypothetical protein
LYADPENDEVTVTFAFGVAAIFIYNSTYNVLSILPPPTFEGEYMITVKLTDNSAY